MAGRPVLPVNNMWKGSETYYCAEHFPKAKMFHSARVKVKTECRLEGDEVAGVGGGWPAWDKTIKGFICHLL